MAQNLNINRMPNESDKQYESRINSSIITVADARIDSTKWESHTGLALVQKRAKSGIPVDISDMPMLCVKTNNPVTLNGEIDIALKYFNGRVYPDYSRMVFVDANNSGNKTIYALAFSKFIFESDRDYSNRMKLLPLCPLGLARPIPNGYDSNSSIMTFETKLRPYASSLLTTNRLSAKVDSKTASNILNVSKNFRLYSYVNENGQAIDLELYNDEYGRIINVYISRNQRGNHQNSCVKTGPSHIDIKYIAHPMDQSIIKVLETARVNKILEKPMEQIVAGECGQLLQTGISVNANTFPEIFKMLDSTIKRLGIKMPDTKIADFGNTINAFATGTDKEPYVVIGNLAPKLLNPKELHFIISHECGHVAMEHMVYHAAVRHAGYAGGFIPVIGKYIAKTIVFPLQYWSRCSEITADRIGLICCGDLQASKKALIKIVAGFTDIDNLDIDEYVSQAEKTRDRHILGRIGEYFASHPMIFKRIKALDLFYNSELYYTITNQPAPANKVLLTKEELDKQVSDLLTVVNLDAIKNTWS